MDIDIGIKFDAIRTDTRKVVGIDIVYFIRLLFDIDVGSFRISIKKCGHANRWRVKTFDKMCRMFDVSKNRCFDTSYFRCFDKLKVRYISIFQSFDISIGWNVRYDIQHDCIFSRYIASVLALSVDRLHLEVLGEETCMVFGLGVEIVANTSPITISQCTVQ